MWPLVCAWRRGEGTQAEIAAREGMPAPTFSWWCQRLAARPTAASAFVAVDVEREAVAERGGEFEVTLSRGRTVRVPSNFDATALSRLIAALERPC